MKNPLRKRIPRELKSNLGKYLAIFLLLTLTITIGSGFLVVADSVEYTLKQNQENCKLEDGNFTTNYEVSEDILEKASSLGLKIEKKYYVDIEGFDKDAIVRIYSNRKELDLASVHEGKLPEKSNEIALDRLFAERRDITVGKTVEVMGKTMTVSGLISLPDYNSLYRRNSDLVMDSIYFGVAVVNSEGFSALNSNTLTYNYGYYFTDRSLNEEKQEKLEAVFAGQLSEITEIAEFLPASENQAISFLENDMGTDIPTMKALIYILIVIMAFVFAVLTKSTIEEDAAIIGTLRASGYRKQELIRHYISLPLFAAALSAVVGNLLGYTVMLAPFKSIYYTSFSISPFMIQWNAEAFILTTVIPIVMMLVINYFIIFRMLSISPLKFLRKELKRRIQKRAIKLPGFRFINRFRLRVILQNKGSYFLLFVGLFFASALLMFGLVMLPLVNNYVDKASESIVAEYEYILKAPVPSNEGEKMTVTNLDTWYDFGDRDLEVVFNGIVEDSAFYKEIPLYNGEQGVVISSDLANMTGIEEGDTVTFKDPYTKKNYDLKVSAVYPYYGSLAVFMRQQDLNQLIGKEADYLNAYLSHKKLDLDEKYIAKIITPDDIRGAAEQMSYSFKGIIAIIDVFAILIYLVLIYLMTKLVIDKNANNISLMKVFGYRYDEVKKLYLQATTIVVVVSLLVSIPLEYATMKLIMKYSLDKIGGYIEFFVPWYTYLEIIFAGILSYFVINSIHVKRVRKISMHMALKSRE